MVAERKHFRAAEQDEQGPPKFARKKRELVKLAKQLLVEEGIEAFSMARVAAAAGVRLSGLQYYIPTRNALIKEIVLDLLQSDWVIFSEISSNDTLSAEEKLRLALDTYVAYCLDVSVTKIVSYFWMASLYDDELMS